MAPADFAANLCLKHIGHTTVVTSSRQQDDVRVLSQHGRLSDKQQWRCIDDDKIESALKLLNQVATSINRQQLQDSLVHAPALMNVKTAGLSRLSYLVKRYLRPADTHLTPDRQTFHHLMCRWTTKVAVHESNPFTGSSQAGGELARPQWSCLRWPMRS